VFNPAKSLFKQPANAKAECETIYCKLDSCPLRDARACMLSAPLGWTNCPYGRVRKETGPTRRAQKFSTWISARLERIPSVGKLGIPAKKMAFVGDYVYLPYAHMTMCEAVPFVAHAMMFGFGTCLLPLTNWTVESVVRLVKFQPRPMLGSGVICVYQDEAVPLFLLHLRETDPAMWEQLIREQPDLDVPPDHVGRKALLKTLAAPLKWTATSSKGKYPVTWNWDGTHVVTTSQHAYQKTWGGLALADIELKAVPADDAEVVVLGNAWVTGETVFTD
jgi:hypothetical protein